MTNIEKDTMSVHRTNNHWQEIVQGKRNRVHRAL